MTDTFAVPVDDLRKIADVYVDEQSFADLTTLHLGGTPRATVHCRTKEAVCAVVELLDAKEIPLLIIGGGSNLVIADGEIPVVAVVMECAQIDVDPTTGVITAEAGAVWDTVVARSVAAGLGGIECLSGIPGSAGATPVQNVGAYGVEIADVLTRVELYDRRLARREWVSAQSLELGYRYSNLKFTNRAVVLAVELALHTDGLSAPLRFGELARAVGAQSGQQRYPIAQVREAVLELRQNKGMVYNEEDHDTWSAGSFFTNPIVDSEHSDYVRAQVAKLHDEQTAQAMPCYDLGDGKKKLSAAWLIDRAGFERGYPGMGQARLSTKHTLALTNRGAAKTEDLVALAREIRDGVKQRFGVNLVTEPVWIGIEL
ncbi:UDP-N-acetylmuramate dehydrogenase [Corynebacterium sp. sy039]|uniref:UDP-N-acetylmuramate dehydrogenase n=1 Tax=Corynebacterium sp. sy039 TaxID=2599641 RepID=UPI0011B598FE|nr:UDP-N-acetylmuramate dehydrogenase [Corynebacterium sp. sy039]